jgi:hypothetical protein
MDARRRDARWERPVLYFQPGTWQRVPRKRSIMPADVRGRCGDTWPRLIHEGQDEDQRGDQQHDGTRHLEVPFPPLRMQAQVGPDGDVEQAGEQDVDVVGPVDEPDHLAGLEQVRPPELQKDPRRDERGDRCHADAPMHGPDVYRHRAAH